MHHERQRLHLARLQQVRLVDGIEHQAPAGGRATRIASSFLPELVHRKGSVIGRADLQSQVFPIITV